MIHPNEEKPANLCWKYYSAIIFAVKLENKKNQQISKPLLEFFLNNEKTRKVTKKFMGRHDALGWCGGRGGRGGRGGLNAL